MYVGMGGGVHTWLQVCIMPSTVECVLKGRELPTSKLTISLFMHTYMHMQLSCKLGDRERVKEVGLMYVCCMYVCSCVYV